jgi:hypothetical protein
MPLPAPLKCDDFEPIAPTLNWIQPLWRDEILDSRIWAPSRYYLGTLTKGKSVCGDSLDTGPVALNSHRSRLGVTKPLLPGT